MRYLIAHRGNINGPNEKRENQPEYILEALKAGYDVEIDVWEINGKLFLGHDKPTYKINLDFLFNNKLWCHAKNFEALSLMILHKDKIHCFSHDNDKHILTSKGYIWAYIGEKINNNTICVMPEKSNYSNLELKNCLGICSDEISKYQ